MLYQRHLTDQEQAVLQDCVLDIKKWIDNAIDGKINCARLRIRERIIKDAKVDIQKLSELDNDIVIAYTKLPGYKCRQDREKERGRP